MKNNQFYENCIHRAQNYICDHIDEDLTLEQIAGEFAFSPFHFHRVFKSVAKETPYNFIKRIRLEKACSMLSFNRDMKIINIALSCGFSTPSSFSSAFKKYFNISPSLYRDSRSGKSSFEIQNSRIGIQKSRSCKDRHSLKVYISDHELENLYKRRREMNVKTEIIPEYRIAYMRRIGSYGPENNQFMQRLKKWAITRDLLGDSSVILGIAHDDPKITPEENCRYDCGIVLNEDYELENEINESVLPGGRYAVLSVEHTPEKILNGWEYLFKTWLPESGYQIDNKPCFERYTSLKNSLKPEPACCEICIPVKKI